MRDTLDDIRKKLQSGVFQNEEHVRLSLVARILSKLGWNIWDPAEVYTEFKTTPSEDRTKVDVALFLAPRVPAVFIEVKAVGGIGNLQDCERQLRDYNKDYGATFCILTDGCMWRLYFAQTGGLFCDKCFKDFNILRDNLDDVASWLAAFLGKAGVQDGTAKKQAEAIVKGGIKNRDMEQALPEARRMTLEPPFPSLPQALVTAKQGESITEEEAKDFLARRPVPPPPLPEPQSKNKVDGPKPPRPIDSSISDPHHPPDLRFTSIMNARFDNTPVRNWNDLVAAGVKAALNTGLALNELKERHGVPLKKGSVLENGYHPIPSTGVSLQYVDANNAWRNALSLAQILKLDLCVEFRWRENEKAAHPGQTGLMRWTPNG